MDHSRVSRSAAIDALVVAIVVALSIVPYVFGLGFYSDDWAIFGEFHRAAAAGELGPSLAVAQFAARPVHGLYAAGLFGLFGLDPLGYHLVNAGVLASAVALFHLLLVRLGVSRRDAFVSAVILIILPQLSTIRAWIAASQIPLSMLFALASLHAQLSFVRTGRALAAIAALAFAALSLAAYETFAPLIGAFPIALALAGRSRTHDAEWRRTRLAAAAVAVLLVLAIVAKLFLSDRGRPVTAPGVYLRAAIDLVRPDFDWRKEYGLNVFAAAQVHFWEVVKGWAKGLSALFEGRLTALAVACSAGGAALAWWRLRSSTKAGEAGLAPVHLLAIGVAAFILGHATYVLVPAVMFAPTGLGNRSLVAAAPGVAMMFAAMLAWIARAGRIGPAVHGAAVALLAFAGTLRIAEIEGYWVEAGDAQQKVLAAAKRDLATLASGSTVLLDGVCPYWGPGVVFETWWDTGPALTLALGRPVEADVVSERARLRPDGFEASIYGDVRVYPYGPRLFAWHPSSHSLIRLPDENAARAYFRRPGRWPTPCRSAGPGQGMLI